MRPFLGFVAIGLYITAGMTDMARLDETAVRVPYLFIRGLSETRLVFFSGLRYKTEPCKNVKILVQWEIFLL